jgi:pyruvate dehydrogenase phosphatase
VWDRITSEEAALLMAGYLAHPKRADVNKETLANEIPVRPTEPRPYPVQEMPGKGKRSQGAWAFEGDANAATHLIRNALGGADRKERGQLLSMHGKTTRYFRDDMTVT